MYGEARHIGDRMILTVVSISPTSSMMWTHYHAYSTQNPNGVQMGLHMRWNKVLIHGINATWTVAW